MVFILQFVNVSHWFEDMKNPCIPGINLTWSWCMIVLMYYWIQFASIFFFNSFIFNWRIMLYSIVLVSIWQYFMEYFCIYVHQWYWPMIFFPFFLWHPCLVLLSGWWWPHRMSLGLFLPLQVLKEFQKGSFNSFLNVC